MPAPFRSQRRRASAALLGALFACFPAWAGELRDELANLARQNGFVIEGLDKVEPGPAPSAEGSPAERVKALLVDYNYLLVGGSNTIEKVRISRRKPSDGVVRSADRAYVKTQRQGSHHQVQVAVAGPNGVGKTLSLLIDTGASTLVLPESMMSELGFAPEALRAGSSHTANGTVPVRVGTLSSVRVGAVSAQDVEVSFIADQQLGGAMLLGMSFLSRFRMTIDDAGGELILYAR
jgi:aspartyl protease family protein